MLNEMTKRLFSVALWVVSLWLLPTAGAQSADEVKERYSIDPEFRIVASKGETDKVRKVRLLQDENQLLWKFFQEKGVNISSPDKFRSGGRNFFELSATPEQHAKVDACLLKFTRGRHYFDAFFPKPMEEEVKQGIVKRKWRIPAEFLNVGGDECAIDLSNEKQDVRRNLICMGAPFPKDSSAHYNGPRRILTVTNTVENMRIVDSAIKQYFFITIADGWKFGELTGKKDKVQKHEFLSAVSRIKASKKYNKKATYFMFCSLHGIADVDPRHHNYMVNFMKSSLDKIDPEKVAFFLVVDRKKDLKFLKQHGFDYPVVMWKSLIKSEIRYRFPDSFLRLDNTRVMNAFGGLFMRNSSCCDINSTLNGCLSEAAKCE